MSEYVLSQEIIKLSESDSWDMAKDEWTLDTIEQSSQPSSCLCGHAPIKELCHIRNQKNGNTTIVGNCCVNKFMGIKSNKLFECLKRVQKDIKASFNADFINNAHKQGIINDWEQKFYIDIWRKHNLSQKQMDVKVKINKKLIAKQNQPTYESIMEKQPKIQLCPSCGNSNLEKLNLTNSNGFYCNKCDIKWDIQYLSFKT